MAHSDSHLTGGIMALIVMALVFDDDDAGPVPPLSDGEPEPGRDDEEDVTPR